MSQFPEIYADFHDKILRYLSQLVGEADAEDVTQEVFVKVNSGLKDFRGESSLSTWIYKIATNSALDYKRKCHEDRVPDAGELTSQENIATDPSTSVDKQLIRKEMTDCIKEIVDGLPENYRTVLILSDLEGLTNNEIAEVLGITLESVKIRLHRARARLKKEMEHHCTFYRDDRNEFACDRKITPLRFLKK